MRWCRVFITVFMILFMEAVAFSGPAWRGELTLTQPDGTEIRAILRGDEFTHVMTDLSGNALLQGDDDVWYYALYSPDGSVHSSGFVAGGDYIPQASSYVPYQALSLKAAALRCAVPRVTALSADGANIEPVKKHCIIILAQFQDVKMSVGEEMFDAIVNRGENSIRKYFEDQFMGAYEFSFDIGPLVTLEKKQSFYGHNQNGRDQNAYLAVKEACERSHDAGVNFSKFDDDGDGFVDNVFLFVAGKDEADGGGDNCIWSHSWNLVTAGIDLELDGKRIGSYAISSELRRRNNGRYSFTSIGTFCHEYSHTLGLVDMYDTDLEGSGGVSECLWGSTSLMDNGNYNNEGRTPPYYDAIDRDMLGIGKPEMLKLGRYVLEPIGENGRYLKYASSNEGEYFLIECRSGNGWDRYVGGRGLAIYHIDKSVADAGFSNSLSRQVTAAERWTFNEVNCCPSRQCAEMLKARADAVSVSQVFYPYGKTNSISSQTNSVFRFNDGTYSDVAITDIMLVGDSVEFSVVPYGKLIPPKAVVTKKDVFQDMAIIQWDSNVLDAGTAYVSWGLSGKTIKEEEITPYEPGKYAFRIEGLKPSSAYSVRIVYKVGELIGKESVVNFTTKSIYKDGYPFIYLKGTLRNDDGSFQESAVIPLCLFNAANQQSVEWFMDGRSITPGLDGYYKLTRSCVLSARVIWTDGSEDIIEKQVIMK